MKRQARTLVGILFAIALVLGYLPTASTAFAANETEPQGDPGQDFVSGTIPETIDLTYPTDKPGKKSGKGLLRSTPLPSSYDTRTLYQTPVQN